MEPVPHLGRNGCGKAHHPDQPCKLTRTVREYRDNRDLALGVVADLTADAVGRLDRDPRDASTILKLSGDLAFQIAKADNHWAAEGDYRSARGAIVTMLQAVVARCRSNGWQVPA